MNLKTNEQKTPKTTDTKARISPENCPRDKLPSQSSPYGELAMHPILHLPTKAGAE